MECMRENRFQSGVGLLETLTGLLVFILLALVGTKAYKGVVTNQKETSQIKALTDAVMVTAERLGSMSVSALTAPGSSYLQWSDPAEIGSGQYHFRYRTVPGPTVAGNRDTTVVGLEVETGSMNSGVFAPSRSFATLIAPHMSSRNALGEVSTVRERETEAAFYAGLKHEIAAVKTAAKADNQVRLNSFNCYDKGQCCPFMERYLEDYLKSSRPDPKDGLDQKCLYRCALGGGVPMEEWKAACNTDFCSIAPWKTKQQCCQAIAEGTCESGTICAQVCIDCVGEDGSTCGPPICDDIWWNDFFDCENGTFCDGSLLPTGTVEGWGNVKELCKNDVCKQFESQCEYREPSCCWDYWGAKNLGLPVDPRLEICATISNQADCCEKERGTPDWTIYCGTDGKMVSARNTIDGKWYCGMKGPAWDGMCAAYRGCRTTYRPSGAPGGGCQNWTGAPISSPWDPSYPNRPVPNQTPAWGSGTYTPPGPGGPVKIINNSFKPRAPSNRSGGGFGSIGGRE